MTDLAKMRSESLDRLELEEPPTVFQGEFLHVPKDDFAHMLKAESEGRQLLAALTEEGELLEEQGLVKGYKDDGATFFDIPNWHRLVTALHAFVRACGPY